MSFEMQNPRSPQAFTWWGMILGGAACLGMYLLVQKFVFGEELNSRVLTTGTVCSVALMLGMFIMYRRGKKKEEAEKNKKLNDDSIID